MTEQAKVIIAGCGYIGRLLARELIHEDYSVTGLVRSSTGLQQCAELGIPCQQMDFDDPDALRNTQLMTTRQRIIYLAPPPGLGRVDTRIKHFLSRIEKQQPEKFVLISTTGVYGDCGGRWIDEQTPINPGVDRAWRRASAEQQAQGVLHDR